MLGFSSDGYDQWAEDSVLVYDYYLEIDKSKITDESIRKYGVEITADGYRFIAKKEARSEQYYSVHLQLHLDKRSER